MKTTMRIALVLFVAAAASAGEPVVRGGVPVDSLTPAGMQRLSVVAPTAVGRPVRLTFGSADRPEVLIDVLVAPDASTARAALDDWLRTVVNRPGPEALGDVGYGEGTLFGFVRDNVLVAVHKVAGEADAAAIAAQADAAVQAAPAGETQAAGVPEQRFDDEQLGQVPQPIVFPSGWIAANVSVCGPGYARHTAGGWVVVRDGPGVVTVRVTGVDDRLRSTR
jgi:hypothetical protein